MGQCIRCSDKNIACEPCVARRTTRVTQVRQHPSLLMFNLLIIMSIVRVRKSFPSNRKDNGNGLLIHTPLLNLTKMLSRICLPWPACLAYSPAGADTSSCHYTHGRGWTGAGGMYVLRYKLSTKLIMISE